MALVLTGGLATAVVGPAGADPEPTELPTEAGIVSDTPWSQRAHDEEAAQAEGRRQAREQAEDKTQSRAGATRDGTVSRVSGPSRDGGGRGKDVLDHVRGGSQPAGDKKRTNSALKKTATSSAVQKPATGSAVKRRAANRIGSPRKVPTKTGSKTSSTRGGALAVAHRLRGIPYVWGGTTTSGFDCSGFTRYVYRKAGVNLPRTAAAQQRAVRRVTTPRPGDLVFFGKPAHHVGIYAGNGKMYDAPRTGRTTGLHKIWSAKASYGRVPGVRVPTS